MAKVDFTNYELHKQLYAALKEPNEKTLHEQFTSLGAWFSVHPDCDYYMLMCREKYDFTTLHFKNMNYKKGMEEVKEILESRGTIFDVNYNQKTDAYECWVRTEDNEFFLYMLFKYDFGVVEVE